MISLTIVLLISANDNGGLRPTMVPGGWPNPVAVHSM